MKKKRKRRESQKEMSCISIQDILKSVDILYDPSVVGNEKAVASEILSRLTESPTYYQIAMEILLSNDNGSLFSLCNHYSCFL